MADVAAAVPVLPLPGTPVPAPAAAVPVPAPVPVPEAKPDPRLADLLAKEKAYVTEKQKFAAERDAWTKERAELESLRGWRSGLVRNPDALKDVYGDGWYETLTDYRLNGAKVTPDLVAASVDAKLAEFEKRQKTERETAAEAARAQAAAEQKAVLDNFRADTAAFVKSKGEEYELINLHEAHNLVTQLIEDHFEKTQKILTAAEAAGIVEAHLAEQVRKSLETRKFKTPAATPGAAPKKQEQVAQPRTLTNAHTGITAPPPSTPGDRPLTEDERIARAVAVGEAVRRARMGG